MRSFPLCPQKMHRFPSGQRGLPILLGPTDKLLSSIRSALEQSKNAVGDEFAAQLEQLTESLSSARRHVAGIAADLAHSEAGSIASQIKDKDGATRRQRTGKVLDALEHEMSSELAKTCTH